MKRCSVFGLIMRIMAVVAVITAAYAAFRFWRSGEVCPFGCKGQE